MTTSLKVAPAELQAAGAAEGAVAQTIAGLAVGQALSTAAAGMAGLQSGAACGEVASVFDGAVRETGAEVGAHAEKLSNAAGAYRGTDDEYARRLGSAQPTG